MKTIISNFILGFFIFCQSGICQTGNQNLIRLKLDFKNSKPIKMSDLISEIRYIPLEANPDCLIGYMNIPVFGKDIIICSFNGGGSIFRFSDQGKFLNKIGQIGRGPEELQDITDLALIGDTVFVVSNFSNDIVCYSLAGNFLKKYHINAKSRPKSIIQLPEKSFMISLSYPSNLGILIKTDRDFNIKTGFINNVPLYDNPLVNSFQKSGDKIFYYYNYLDTIFDISSGCPLPSIVMDYGNFNKKNNEILNKPSIIHLSTSNSYLTVYTYYPFNYGTYTTLYRIVDGKQFIWTKLINDVDHGTLDRWPGFLSESDLIFWLMPSTVLERFGKMTDSEKKDPKNSGFVEMASKLKPESNPVIMICKLKP